MAARCCETEEFLKLALPFILVLGLVLGDSAWGDEIRPLYRSARAQAMGGAYVGLADDESAVFLNPAGLAGQQKTSFVLVNGDVEISQDSISSFTDFKGALSKFDTSVLSKLMGKNLYGRVSYDPIFVMPNFSLAGIYDGQAALYSSNRALPQVLAGYQVTNGLQSAIGVSLIQRKRPRPGQNDLRIGIAGKMLWRRGGYYLLTPAQLLQASTGTGFLSNIAGTYKSGFGADAGLHYVQPLSKTMTFSLGAAYRDIGNTSFEGPASPIFSNLVVGGALKYKAGLLNVNLAYDHSHLTNASDWRTRNHVGVEFGVPFLTLYGGINQVYPTYGARMDLGFLKATVLYYGTETGTVAYSAVDQRYMMNLTFQFDF